MKKYLGILGLCGITLVPSTSLAGLCWLDNAVSGASSPMTFPGCGHRIYGSGAGGCVVNISNNHYATNNADCISLGNGVTLQAASPHGATIRCATNQEPCGKAIAINDGNGSGNTKVINIDTTGCFSDGIYGSIPNAQEASEVYITGGGGANCPANYRQAGIKGVNIVNRAVVSGWRIGLDEGDHTVNDSIITLNEYGVAGGGGGSMNNVLIYDNDVAFIKGSGTGNTHIKASAVVTNAPNGSCETCFTGSGCASESYCLIDFTTSTPTAFDYKLVP